MNNTNIKDIDFATVHAWPDNWLIPQVGVGVLGSEHLSSPHWLSRSMHATARLLVADLAPGIHTDCPLTPSLPPLPP